MCSVRFGLNFAENVKPSCSISEQEGFIMKQTIESRYDWSKISSDGRDAGRFRLGQVAQNSATVMPSTSLNN